MRNHRSIFAEVGLFDEALPACEDYDLWLRISKHYEIGFLPEPLVTRFGGHRDQLSQKYWGMDRFRIQAMEKHINTEMGTENYTALLKELVFKCGVVSQGALKRNNATLARVYVKKAQTYRGQLETLTLD